MKKRRRQHTESFKGQVALEALKGDRTISELASHYEVHPNQIKTWRSHLTHHVGDLFRDKRRKKDGDKDQLIAELYQQVGQLTMELDWLKKSLLLSVDGRRQLIDHDHPVLSLRRQAALLGMSRSSVYYVPRVDPYDVVLMGLIDEIYTEFPFYGSRKIREQLYLDGHRVCRERVQRLMRQMGIEAIYPKRRTSVAHPDHQVYPYLLRGVEVTRVNQVWSCDITYIRMRQGWLYLMAIMDWYSRFVLSWEFSITLDVGFCLTALERALTINTPEIFNSDQGSQFTSRDFTGMLLAHDIQISMDGRGRVFDNIFIERLWRSVKYEEVYLHDYESVTEAKQSLCTYFNCYNNRRLHQSLGYRTPVDVYKGVPLK